MYFSDIAATQKMKMLSLTSVASILLRNLSSFPAETPSCWSRIIAKIQAIKNKIFEFLSSIYNFIRPINVVTQRREFHLIPVRLEKFIGSALYRYQVLKAGGEISETDALYGQYVTMVRSIGAELAKKSPREGLDFEFKVVDDPTENAWCLPGGKIAIHLGLIQKMERETETFGLEPSFSLEEKIAAVLSHEITHATARHTGRLMECRLFFASLIKAVQIGLGYLIASRYNEAIQAAAAKNDLSSVQKLKNKRDTYTESNTWFLSRLAAGVVGGIGLCKSRSHELEADKYGMHLFWHVTQEKNGLNFTENSVRSAVWLQHFFKKKHPVTGHHCCDSLLNLFQTHPSPVERLEENKRTFAELRQNKED